MKTLRVATRGSAQARAQASVVAELLMQAHPGLHAELVFVETLGDRRADVPLHAMGGQGVFVKEVQRAVLEHHADIAVHSAKDMTTVDAGDLRIGAFCQRRDPRDALVGLALNELPHAATVATGSVRREAQLHHVRPDLRFGELRGNIHTRLEKIPPGGSVVIAVAALQILELTHRIAEYLPVDPFVPSPGQGCVAVECRADDDTTAALLGTIDDPATRSAVETERAFLAELGTGCSLPVGAHVDGRELLGFLARDGRALIRRIELSDDRSARRAIAARLAREMYDELHR